jgi:hypothetical protein
VRWLRNVLIVFDGGRKISLTHTATFLAKPLRQIVVQISIKENPRALCPVSRSCSSGEDGFRLHFPEHFRLHHEVLAEPPEGKEKKMIFNILNLVVCILLRVLDQVQGFPSNATLFQ